MLTLWDVASGAQLDEVRDGGSLVVAGGKSRVVASVSWHQQIKVWDVIPEGTSARLRARVSLPRDSFGGVILGAPAAHEGPRVLAVAVSMNGQYLAAGGSDQILKVWDLQGASPSTPPRPLPGFRHESRLKEVTIVRALAFSADGKRLASGSSHPCLWDVATGGFVCSFLGSAELICSSISFNATGRQLAATFNDGQVRVWDIETRRVVLSPHRDGAITRRVAFSPADPAVLALVRGKEAFLERLASERMKGNQKLDSPGKLSFQALAFSPDGNRLVARAGVHLLFWDVKALPNARARSISVPEDIRAGVTFSPNGEVVSGAGPRGLQVWDASGRPSGKLAVAASGARAVAFSSDGRLLATGDDGASVRLWDTRAGDEIQTLDGFTGGVLALAFEPQDGPKKGTRLALGGTGGLVQVRDVKSGKVVSSFRNHRHEVTCLAFSPDGRFLATGSADQTLGVWDASNGNLRARMLAHAANVTGLAFSPDGARLASASLDGTVKLWDAASGQEVLTLTGHEGPVTGIAFSPDGQRLASCGHDGGVQIWDAEKP